LHVEPVVWVIGRKDLLAAVFYLAAALNYLRFVERQRRRHYGYALALFTLGLLCKSIIVSLPVALLIWHWGKRGRVTGADLARVAPLLLVGLCLIAADLAFYKDRDPTAFDYSPLERALIAGQALWFHAGKLVWPAGLSVIYPRWEVGAGNAPAWACLLGAIAVITGLWAARRRIGRGALAGVLLFVVTLSPTLGFV
ncbi:MAG: glycosyltransferase family 39 protein, partial [Gammaproteobacteria bacterium]|nr:glycosyltransferase family 39 protein [Gammaproteobacteria bacterium]